MAYTPSAFDITRPVDTDIAETAQLEFRTMKAFYMGTVAKFAVFGGNIGNTLITNFTTSIPAGILGTTKTIKVRITGAISNSTGGTINVFWQILYGGVVVAQGNLFPINTGGQSAYEIYAEITNNSATNVQVCFAHAHIFDINSAAGTATNATANTGSRNSIAVDSTVAQNLVFNTQNGSAINMTNSMDKAFVIWQ